MTIFNYRATEEGDIVSFSDDTELIQLAKAYGVAPLMFISTISEDGILSSEVIYNILNNPPLQDLTIEKILEILKMKGFSGINIYTES